VVGASDRVPSGAITAINVTPLVDITLVLLIIFMVTAKLIVSHKALPVDLPKAATGSDDAQPLTIVLSSTGGTQLNGRMLDSDEAILGLARGIPVGSDTRAIINADGSVPHRRVMHVLDLLRQAGISKIGFGVEPHVASPGSVPSR
jgi:biopolymer transport protein ExbD